jgi:hypothetical protein
MFILSGFDKFMASTTSWVKKEKKLYERKGKGNYAVYFVKKEKRD